MATWPALTACSRAGAAAATAAAGATCATGLCTGDSSKLGCTGAGASTSAQGSQAKAEIGFALTGDQGSGRAREVGGTLAVVAWQAVGKALGLARHRAVCVWPLTLLC